MVRVSFLVEALLSGGRMGNAVCHRDPVAGEN